MPVNDPNNKKTNLDRSNDYDEDNKITNNEYPVREGQEDSSILHDEGKPDEASSYPKLQNPVNPPIEQEEFIDDDRNVDEVAEE